MKNLSLTTARDLMIEDVATIDARATLRDATRMMRDRKLRCLVVPPALPGQGLGILTTKDVITAIDHQDPNALIETLVEDLMTRPAVCAQATLCIPDCVSLMRMTGVRRMPVLEGDRMIGMLSYSDVFRVLAEGV
jgi:isocitrate dehydrogenase